jgi:hypothetical protein
MGYSLVLLGIATVLVMLIQALRLVVSAPSYPKRALNLSLGVSFLFIPMALSLMTVGLFRNQIDTNFLFVFVGIGMFLAVYFCSKAALNM